MFKFIKKLFKVVAAIVGAYLAFNTLVLAKIGTSRIARELRIRYQEGTMPDNMLDAIWEIDSAVIEEAEEEFAAFEEVKNAKVTFKK